MLRNSKRGIGLLLLIFFSLPCCLHAQIEETLIWKKIVAANNFEKMKYHYAISLIDQSGRITDSINGMLYKAANNYIDSSNVSLSMSNNEYFAKADHVTKLFEVYSKAALKKRMNISGNITKSDNIASVLSDSLIQRHSKMKVSKSSAGNIVVELSFKDIEIRKMIVELASSDFQIRSFQFDIIETDRYGDATGFSRRYVLSNISYQFSDAEVDLRRFFTVVNGKIVPGKTFNNYKLNSLIN